MIYTTGSSATVSCFSNFTIMSIKWTTSSNITFTTQIVGSQDIILSIDRISRAFHDKNFTCEVRNLLPDDTITTSMTNFRINTEELCKNQYVLNELEYHFLSFLSSIWSCIKFHCFI